MDHHLEIVKTNIKYPIVFYNHQFNKSRPVSPTIIKILKLYMSFQEK